MATRDIGIKIGKLPDRTCTDNHCPFHGSIAVRGRIFEGVVTSTKRQKTVTVRRDFLFMVPKYRRYERRNSKLSVHCPDCIDVNEGDTVLFMETRRISKTVSSVVIENKSTARADSADVELDEEEEV